MNGTKQCTGYKPIRDYGIIGNLRSAALVAKDGSIDWMCVPYLDSPSVFAAILDAKRGGLWRVAPTGTYTSEQAYIPNTNILQTTFHEKNGVSRLTDFMPIGKLHPKEAELEKRGEIIEVLREVTCEKGSCSLEMRFDPRFQYARDLPRIVSSGNSFQIIGKKDRAVLMASHKDAASFQKYHLKIRFKLKEGERRFWVFRYNTTQMLVRTKEHCKEEFVKTKEYWEGWVHRCDIGRCPVWGPWHNQIVRSSLVLKILFFEPVGSIAAAATTSLPEVIGGKRNWDYRYAWVRDSSFILKALFPLGYVEEAREFISWILGCCKKSKDPKHMQVMYGLWGQRRLTEESLAHLEGYCGSRPVRIGNKAYQQKQWDIYGEVLDMIWGLHTFEKHDLHLDHWPFFRSIVDHVTRIWKKPDQGIWEMRKAPQHFTHSKLLCWVALDRGIKIAELHKLPADLDYWKQVRADIKKAILDKGWSAKKQSFTQSFGGEDLDASLLRIPILGFLPPQDPRVQSTINRVWKELGTPDGLLYRYKGKDGLSKQDGAFLVTSFWLVDALALSGRLKEAERVFAFLANKANHLGLYAEEMDPRTEEFLGNFPQALTHIGFINSAMYLEQRKRQKMKSI